MRKGFVLTLTALVTALWATSAFALGPTVSAVPDVYIGPEGYDTQVEPSVNMFRYTDALVLWDYVTPGVDEGNGSTSDTLYWSYAVKKADFDGGTGSFLDPTLAASDPDSIHYSIVQGNDVTANVFQASVDPEAAGWVADVNGEINGLGAGLPDYGMDVAGALTFRNIRLSPPPDQNYAAPTADPDAPAGYLDVQEATIYVSDGTTTPGYATMLMVTMPSGKDVLSGGPVFELVGDYSASSAALSDSFLLKAVAGGHVNGQAQVGTAVTDASVANNGTGTITLTTPVTNNPSNRYYYVYYGLPGTDAAASMEAGYLYRLSADITVPDRATAPSVLLFLNGRSTGPGLGFAQWIAGGTDGPTASAANFAAYLWPAAAGAAPAQIASIDTNSSVGGTMTVTNVKLHKLDVSELGEGTELLSQATFSRDDADNTAGKYNTASIKYGDATQPTISFAPANGATGAEELVINGATGTTVNPAGYGQFNSSALFTASAGAMVVVEASVSSSSAADAVIPHMWLDIGKGVYVPGYIKDRADSAVDGPSTTPKTYYCVFDSRDGGDFSFSFRGLVDSVNMNGNIRLQSLTVKEYEMPDVE